MGEWVVPAANAEDSDDVVVALETARISEERDDLKAAAKWLHRAAAAARHQSRPERAGSLSRTAASLLRASGNFEPKPDEEQVLSDIDDEDFAEQTIVDSKEKLASKGSRKGGRRETRDAEGSTAKNSGADPEIPKQDGSSRGSKSSKAKNAMAALPAKASDSIDSKPEGSETKASAEGTGQVVEKPTPLAPLTGQPMAAAHEAIRVAVRRKLGGKFEARPLSDGESPGAGEHEALLVPTQGGSRLS